MMEEQGATVTIISLPSLSPAGFSVYPGYSGRPTTFTNHASTRETSLITTSPTIFEPTVRFQAVPVHGASDVATKNTQHSVSGRKLSKLEVLSPKMIPEFPGNLVSSACFESQTQYEDGAHGSAIELRETPRSFSSYKSELVLEKAQEYCPADRATEVRLVSPESSSKTETVLRIDSSDEPQTVPPDGKERKLNIVRPTTFRNHASTRETSLITTSPAIFEPTVRFQAVLVHGASDIATKYTQHSVSGRKLSKLEVLSPKMTPEFPGNLVSSACFESQTQYEDGAHGSAIELRETPRSFSSYKSELVLEKAQEYCPADRATEVRLVSPESSSKTETVLRIDSSDEPQTVPPDGKERKLNIIQRLKEEEKSNPKLKYTKLQWIAIFSAWFLAMNGLVLFLSYLGFGLSGYYSLHLSKYSSIFIAVNGIVSAAATVYFWVKVYNFCS